jgi:hypothetical protein
MSFDPFNYQNYWKTFKVIEFALDHVMEP